MTDTIITPQGETITVVFLPRVLKLVVSALRLAAEYADAREPDEIVNAKIMIDLANELDKEFPGYTARPLGRLAGGDDKDTPKSARLFKIVMAYQAFAGKSMKALDVAEILTPNELNLIEGGLRNMAHYLRQNSEEDWPDLFKLADTIDKWMK